MLLNAGKDGLGWDCCIKGNTVSPAAIAAAAIDENEEIVYNGLKEVVWRGLSTGGNSGGNICKLDGEGNNP